MRNENRNSGVYESRGSVKKGTAFSAAKRAACLLLTVLLSVNTMILPARAASRSEQDILKLFPAADSARYNETGFRMTHEEMALLVANVLEENGYNVDVIYDDKDSTSTKKEYILMCGEKDSKNAAVLPMGVDITMGDRQVPKVLTVYLLTSQWNEKQRSRVMPVMADVYEELHGNMTDEKRRSFVTDRNIISKDSGHTAYGDFDGLYYELSFYEDKESFLVTPMSGETRQQDAIYYKEPYTLYGAEGYTIRTGKLSRNPQGDILLEVDLINESKNPLLFHMTHMLAEEYDVASTIYTVVSPGNTKTEQIQVDASLLASGGVQSLIDLGLYFRVEDQKTGEELFNYKDHVLLGMQIRGDYHSHCKELFRNEEFCLTVTGSGLNPVNGAPEIYLMLENGVYGNVLLQTQGNCVAEKQEYDLYGYGLVSGFGKGLTAVQLMMDTPKKNTQVEFDLQISSFSYNPLVTGRVCVTLDSQGRIVRASCDMKETASYREDIEKAY